MGPLSSIVAKSYQREEAIFLKAVKGSSRSRPARGAGAKDVVESMNPTDL